MILGVDPGRQKTGLAIVNGAGEILWRRIVPTPQLEAALREVLKERPVAKIALGHSTNSEVTATLIEGLLNDLLLAASLQIVDERDSTLEARGVYFESHPPSGWRRLVPLSLQTPPEPIDDFAAVVLARRSLNETSCQGS